MLHSVYYSLLLLALFALGVQAGIDPSKQRCAFTKGTWCTNYAKQEPVPWKPAPRGSKECPGGCNNVGRCNYDTGLCDCPAGWTGLGCKTPQKRPCTHKQRKGDPGENATQPYSHIGPDGRDLDWTNVPHPQYYSRCGGICDDDVAICYCDGPMGRIPAPPGSPPGTPPLQVGRPLMTMAHAPKTTWDGRKAFGEVDYNLVYGPRGYCNVTDPEWVPNCGMDGLWGRTCDEPIQMFCPGGCAGHGRCYLGYCICDEGYYGHDCARRKAGLPLLPSTIPTTRWLAEVVREPPAALEPPPAPTRKRPLIYVYDLEPMYQAKILQYRVTPRWCVHRWHVWPNNHTEWTDLWVYAMDTLLHESLLVSPHRTFDPEEADFFYVPHQASCLPFPIGAWADFPWFPDAGGPRTRQMLNMVIEAVQWINATFPFWQRRGGRDHIFTFTHDEGACWAPNIVNNSIWLTHWGRMELNHTSNTAYLLDKYDRDTPTLLQPDGFVHLFKGHPCYNPDKDLVIPAFKAPGHYASSGLVGAPTRERDLLFFFRGDVGKRRQPNYSRGVRQAIYRAAKEGDWATKHKFFIGGHDDIKGEYSNMLGRAKFCLVAPGDGWSARMEDAVLHGCIPVIIADGVHAVFESILDIDDFGLRIPQDQVPRILDILLAVPARAIRSKQAHLGRVWQRFRYASIPGLSEELKRMQLHNKPRREAEAAAYANATAAAAAAAGGGAAAAAAPKLPLPQPFTGDPTEDDAFDTIMQWLYSRIPHTRG
ncbi:hypothetical protein HYH02_000842 [Chlamydomonas schloesseri]|uniref:EGF-like domain-containing protein n=1 Tax=Chlamydomonas schloesseri TaxID=2026947 RepID=A0A836BD15_9CHLO|nr:hypothetical protein HYH02_000842 [Chlamydomonas schloesseri]|eukprot:KAG2455017.1 hypothetical protein HYH02_000842 [Chlamydomonas schloesseri]